MDDRSPADANDSGSDWDDESTLDFTSPRQQTKTPLRSPYHAAIQQDDDQSDLSDHRPKPKERSTTGQMYDNGEAAQRGSKIIPKQRNMPEASPQPSSRHPITDNPPYDFKGALADERNLEDTGQRPGRDRKGNLYDIPPGTPPQPASAMENGGGNGSWDDSDAEERTLRELNATLKKEKKREHAEKIKQRRQEQKDAERFQAAELPVTQSERASRGYNSGRNQRGYQSQPQDGTDGPYVDNSRQEVMSPYTTRDIVLDVHGADKHFDDSHTVLPVVFHDEEGARMLYHFKPCNMKAFEVPDTEDEAIMPGIADKAEKVMRRLWLEVFGSLRLVTSIFVIFITEALRYIFHHIFQPITMGILTGVGDFFLKPLLSLTFSLIVQPIVVFLWNVMTGVRHLSQPVIDILNGVLSQVAMVLRAFRLFDVTYQNSSSRPVRNV